MLNGEEENIVTTSPTLANYSSQDELTNCSAPDISKENLQENVFQSNNKENFAHDQPMETP